MGSSSHRQEKTRALVERYLDPRARWSAAQDRELRAMCREDEECAAVYDRSVTLHRLLVGADPDLPSGFEQQRMMGVLIDPVPLPKRAETVEPLPMPKLFFRRWLGPMLAGAAALAAVAIVASSSQVRLLVLPGERVGDHDFAARGGRFELTVGIGISGVTAGDLEYEVLEKGTALHLEEYMRITTTREVDEHGYVFVFGLQDGKEPLWYSPNPDEGETQSQPVQAGRSIPLGGRDGPFQMELSVRHSVGPLMVVAIFTDEPIAVAAAQAALAERPESVPVERWLKAMLGLASGEVIRILEVEVAEGERAPAGGVRGGERR